MNPNAAKYVLQKIDQEGFHYCFNDYSDFHEIDDKKFHILRLEYLKLAHDLIEYLEVESKNDCKDDERFEDKYCPHRKEEIFREILGEDYEKYEKYI